MLCLQGNKGKLNFNLRDYATKEEVLAAVDRIQYLGENTNMTGGIKVARLEVFDPNYQRPYVDRVIVLITDGVPTYDSDKLDDEVATVKRMGIRIVGLGVTNKVILSILFCLLLSRILCQLWRLLVQTIETVQRRACQIIVGSGTHTELYKAWTREPRRETPLSGTKTVPAACE